MDHGGDLTPSRPFCSNGALLKLAVKSIVSYFSMFVKYRKTML